MCLQHQGETKWLPQEDVDSGSDPGGALERQPGEKLPIPEYESLRIKAFLRDCSTKSLYNSIQNLILIFAKRMRCVSELHIRESPLNITVDPTDTG